MVALRIVPVEVVVLLEGVPELPFRGLRRGFERVGGLCLIAVSHVPLHIAPTERAGARPILGTRCSASSRLDAHDPGGDLAVREAGGVELVIPHLHHRDPDDVAALKVRIGCDVDAGDREGPVEPDPPKRPMRLLTEVTAWALVQRDRERRGPVGPKPDERETPPDIAAKHR